MQDRKLDTVSAVVHGEAAAIAAAARVLRHSQWFELTPLPDGFYLLQVKPENRRLLPQNDVPVADTVTIERNTYDGMVAAIKQAHAECRTEYELKGVTPLSHHATKLLHDSLDDIEHDYWTGPSHGPMPSHGNTGPGYEP